MAKTGSIAWHQQKIDEIRATHSKKALAQHAKKRAEDTPKPTKSRKQPLPRYEARVDYDFLKYVRVVFKWALENNPELNRPQIELLLYLYGIGAFSKKQFNEYHKLLGLYSIKTLQMFEDEGFIKIWRVRNGRTHALYTLTHKGKTLCSDMHKFSCGVKDLPESSKMNREGAPRINNYYLEAIKKMNKDKAPTK